MVAQLTLTEPSSDDAPIWVASLIADELDAVLKMTFRLDATTVVRQDQTKAPFCVLEQLSLRSNKEAP